MIKSAMILPCLLLATSLSVSPVNAEDAGLDKYRVWKSQVELPENFGAARCNLASEWASGKMKYKILFVGTESSFPNQENLIGPLKADGRTAAYDAKRESTIKLKIGADTLVPEIPGSAFTIALFEEKPKVSGAVYWGELPLSESNHHKLVERQQWSISKTATVKGDALQGPDNLGRIYSHRYSRDDSSNWYDAK